MANVNDTSRVSSRLENQWELLEAADINERDRAAIRAFCEYRRDVDDLKPSSLISNLSPLRLGAERANVPLVDMGEREFVSFVDLLKTPKDEGGYGLDPATGTRRYKYPLRVLFGWMDERDAYGDYPFYEDITLADTMGESVDRDHTLSRAEVLALKRGAKYPRDKALIGFLADTGGRKTLVLNLRVGDIKDLDEEVPAYVPNTEGIAQKDVPIQKYPILHARAEIRTYLNRHHVDADTPEAPLWHVLRGYDHDDPQAGALSSSTLDHALEQARQNASMEIATERVHAHNFRHFRFTEFDRSGEYNDSEMQYAGGWNSREMVDHYTHTSDEERIATFNAKAGFGELEESAVDVDPETVTICGNCRRELYSEERFCPGCGAPQVPEAGDRIERVRDGTRERTVTEDDQTKRSALVKLAEAADLEPAEVETLLDG
jgi:integrase